MSALYIREMANVSVTGQSPVVDHVPWPPAFWQAGRFTADFWAYSARQEVLHTWEFL
jgi:hypothetical protein